MLNMDIYWNTKNGSTDVIHSTATGIFTIAIYSTVTRIFDIQHGKTDTSYMHGNTDTWYTARQVDTY